MCIHTNTLYMCLMTTSHLHSFFLIKETRDEKNERKKNVAETVENVKLLNRRKYWIKTKEAEIRNTI